MRQMEGTASQEHDRTSRTVAWECHSHVLQTVGKNHSAPGRQLNMTHASLGSLHGRRCSKAHNPV